MSVGATDGVPLVYVQILRLEQAMKILTFVVSALFGLFVGLASASPPAADRTEKWRSANVQGAQPHAMMDLDGNGNSDVLWLLDNHNGLGELYTWLMSGSSFTGQKVELGLGVVPVVGIGDLDGDGRADIVYFEGGVPLAWNGNVWVERMLGGVVLDNQLLGKVTFGWTPLLVGDLNGDGHKDVLWADSAGHVAAWLVAWDGTNFSYTLSDLGIVGPGWTIAALADIDGDGVDDIIWFHQASGGVFAWLMTLAGQVGSVVQIGTVANGWTIQGVADFDGDGKADIFWRYGTNNVIWYLNGASVESVNFLPDTGIDWHIIAVGDYNGDGKNDLLWQYAYTGGVYQWLMQGRGFNDAIPGAVNLITYVYGPWVSVGQP